MTPRPLAVFLSVALVFPSAAFAQSAKETKDAAKAASKAQKLVENNGNYKKLSAVEQKAVIDHIVFKDGILEDEITGASVLILKGNKTLAELQASRTRKKCEPVLTQENCIEKVVQPTYEWKSRMVPLPPFGELFEDNESSYLKDSDEDKEMKASIQKVVDLIKTQGGRITSIEIESSASTLRNTGAYEGKTHLKLSTDRAKNAAIEIEAFLKNAGVPLPLKTDGSVDIELSPEGENGNGTSGPSSPYKCPKKVKNPKEMCPEGKGDKPSRQEMIDYVASLDPKLKEAKPSDFGVEGTEEPGSAAPPRTQAPQLPAIKGLGGKTVAEPTSAPSCAAPVMTDKELIDAYYDQFKYTQVNFEVSYPVKIEDEPGSTTKECTAREIDVCVSTYKEGDVPHKKKHRVKKHRVRRALHCLSCTWQAMIAALKNDTCPNHNCSGCRKKR